MPFWIVFSLILVPLEAQDVKTTHSLMIKGKIFKVAIVRDEVSRMQGLMGVRDLMPHQGMLFVFERPQHLFFWMKNTPLPLSLAYISAQGEIEEMHDMIPFSEEVVSSRHAVLYALEVPQGSFAGINVGDIVEGLP